ncbi:MAG TPA: hypothetical protein VMV29_11325 [Ktedonobacterales bacterium]|nr:hypothetical protein [Ktedonobacterales bacterium]
MSYPTMMLLLAVIVRHSAVPGLIVNAPLTTRRHDKERRAIIL